MKDVVSNLNDFVSTLADRSQSANELLVSIEELVFLYDQVKVKLGKKLGVHTNGVLNASDLANQLVSSCDETEICGNCNFEVSPLSKICPYCDSKFTYSEPEERAPSITPVTQKPLLPGPTEKTKRGKRGRYSKSTRMARQLINWIRKAEFVKGFPYSADQLTKFHTNDLRTLASLCRGYTVEKYRHFKKDDYIQFIMGRQHKPIDIGPCPADCIPDTLKATSREL